MTIRPTVSSGKKSEQRFNVGLLVKFGKNRKKTILLSTLYYVEDGMNQVTFCKWYKAFKEGRRADSRIQLALSSLTITITHYLFFYLGCSSHVKWQRINLPIETVASLVRVRNDTESPISGEHPLFYV